MYGINARRKDLWKEVTIIIWGATAKLVSENKVIQAEILEGLDIEVIHQAGPFTKTLKSDETLITI